MNFKMKSRSALRRKRQKENDPEVKQKLCDDILDLSDKIKFLKQEVVYCDNVKTRTLKMKSNLIEMEEKAKEKAEQEKNKKGKEKNRI